MSNPVKQLCSTFFLLTARDQKLPSHMYVIELFLTLCLYFCLLHFESTSTFIQQNRIIKRTIYIHVNGVKIAEASSYTKGILQFSGKKRHKKEARVQ